MKRQQRLDRFYRDEFIDPALPIRISEYVVNRSWSLHWHDFFEMEIIVTGSGKQRLNGVEMPLAPGTAYLLTPTDVHELYPGPEGMRLINLKFSEEMLDGAVRERLNRKDFALFARLAGETFERATADARLIERECRATANRFGKKEWLQATLGRMLIDYIRHAETGRGTDRTAQEATRALQQENGDYGLLGGALAYIRLHFREPLTLKGVAERTGLSPNYFSERFHELTGQPFQSYLLELRLEHARQLLAASACSVTEICHAAGFNTLPHFIRAFKKKYGHPPGATRKAASSPENKATNRNNG
ncbi:MAG: helix-turn-helix transcriptional regulator [Paenibacillaceae bacterium]|nr:helix-turn-helix transcriptional regulator [Paenibacillaceae bacterium]